MIVLVGSPVVAGSVVGMIVDSSVAGPVSDFTTCISDLRRDHVVNEGHTREDEMMMSSTEYPLVLVSLLRMK